MPALLAALAVATSPAVAVAQTSASPADAPFACPEEGRVPGEAPQDYHQGADARCIAEGSMAVLYGPDGLPLKRMTRVGPGWYFTGPGYALADEQFRRVQRERKACEEELAKARVPVPGVPVAPAVIGKQGWPTGVVVGAAVVGVLAGGYLGCRAGGGCK